MKVTYIDHMGSDLQVVNCARVSFDKASDWVYTPILDEFGNEVDEEASLSTGDQRLIGYLARGCTTGDWDQILEDIETDIIDREDREKILNYIRRMPKHWVPFANGGTILLHFKVPIFVARQLQKHQAGFEPQSEVSRRYVTTVPEFYEPDGWRKAADNVKQGSSNDFVDMEYNPAYLNSRLKYLYLQAIDNGVCPEQARMLLPQSMYTEYFWKGNLYAWASLYNTRIDSHAQREVQEVAKQIGEIIEPLYPVSWKELTR